MSYYNNNNNNNNNYYSNDDSSPYDDLRRNRGTISVNLWDSNYNSINSYENKKWCLSCIPQERLIVKDGNMWCSSCGHIYKDFPPPKLSAVEARNNNNSKYQNKYGNATGRTNTTIILKGGRVKRSRKRSYGSVNDELSEEEVSELRAMGINIS